MRKMKNERHKVKLRNVAPLLASLLDETVQLDHGDVVVLDPAGQAPQPLVLQLQRGAVVLLCVPEDSWPRENQRNYFCVCSQLYRGIRGVGGR